MVELPKVIKVGPTLYAVEGITPLVAAEDGQRKDGQCNTSQSVIRVDTQHSPAWQRIILAHEILHAMSDYAEANLTERQVSKLEAWLVMFCADNPEAISFLAGE